jgi:hypothetical protein
MSRDTIILLIYRRHKLLKQILLDKAFSFVFYEHNCCIMAKPIKLYGMHETSIYDRK